MNALKDLLAARRGQAKQGGFDSRSELHPTSVSASFTNGLVRGIDGSVWLVRKMRLAPYVDAVSLNEQLRSVDGVIQWVSLLAGMANSTIRSRFVSKGSYRHVQALLVNLPRWFEPDGASPLALKHRRDYGSRITDERLLLMAVRLNASSRGGGLRGFIETETESLLYGGIPLSSYERDADDIGSIFTRAGMSVPSAQELALADSWWSDRRRPDSHFALHPDHLHVFASASSAQMARAVTDVPCEEWPQIPGHSILTMAAVSEIDLDFAPSDRPYVQWVSDAVAYGAVAVSVRASVEPAKISAEEMRRQLKRVRGDISEAVAANRQVRGDREENLQLLYGLAKEYDKVGLPTLHDASVVMAFSGKREERRLMQSSAAQVRVMEDVQFQALKEMQLASGVRANPHRLEMPVQVLACSGMTSLNRSGDASGVILGFDERDQQVSYLDHTRGSRGDAAPVMGILGATGSGKQLAVSTLVPTPTGATTIGALTEGDIVLARDGQPCTVTRTTPVKTPQRAYRIILSDGQVFHACSNHQWIVSDRSGRGISPEAARRLEWESWMLSARLSTVAGEFFDEDRLSLKEIFTRYQRVPGARLRSPEAVRAALDMMDTPADAGGVYCARRAFLDLAARAYQRTLEMGSGCFEQVVSTEEMLTAGVTCEDGTANWAIRVSAPLDLPEADLPLPPYAFGACLGGALPDGTEDAGALAQVAGGCIPMSYLRCSRRQRLAVLQGLMDACGATRRDGLFVLEVDREMLACDALTLIRSLGIVASRDASGITFTTDLPVFALRSASASSLVREVSRWIGIEAIEPIDAEPMRCITVDSPDSSYLVGDFVPTHNTMVGLNILDQLAAMNAPSVFIDPKTHEKGEGHGPVVRAMGGQVYSLDSLLGSDGVFDPVRFMPDKQAAVESATDMLLQINLWGQKKSALEVKLSAALQYGIVDRDASCIGQALRFAFEDGRLEGAEEIFTECEALKDSSPTFGAVYGRDPHGQALNVHDGVTLIEVGQTYLATPPPGTRPENQTVTQRTAAALVRQMVFGSSMALTGRFGVVMLDEAWVFLAAGKEEIERLGRLARSQKVFPILMTQRVTDAVDAGLAGYFSRGLILHLSDEVEAKAALKLFKVEETSDRLERIMAREKDPSVEDTEGYGLNPRSLKALVYEEPDPDFPGLTRRVVRRGSVGFYADMDGRFIPVEMVMPEEFLLLASTNPTDIARRERVIARRRRTQARRKMVADESSSVEDFEAMLAAGEEASRTDGTGSLFDVRASQRVGDASRVDDPHESAERIAEGLKDLFE